MPFQELMNKRHLIRIGSRTSELALKQTDLIMNLLSKAHPELGFKVVTMDTIGDKILDKELSKIGDKSLFTKELELALLANEVDFVVHSLKDVPTALPKEFTLGCICLRSNVEDAVVMKNGLDYKNLEELPKDSIVGTSSVRRIAQLKSKYTHLKFSSVRGNLNTRLKKLDSHATANVKGTGDVPEYSALILAKAGLERLGLGHRISQTLSDEESLYAVGQGALACECRANDEWILKLLSSIHDDESGLTCIAERSLMRQLDGGCSTPIAVRSVLNRDDGTLTLKAAVMSVDGSQRVSDELSVWLPEEDVEVFLSRIQAKRNDDDDCEEDRSDGSDSATLSEDDCSRPPPAKRRRRRLGPAKEHGCQITDDEVALSRDPSAMFLGVRVAPICEIGRVRMALSRRLGAVLADRLLAAGAKTILDGIPRTQGELNQKAATVTASRKEQNAKLSQSSGPIYSDSERKFL